MLSVILPTYNCRPLMKRHLAAMARWADLAEEIIVVDSRSDDGTLEFIRANLSHPKLRIIERDRGLYESWNEGIATSHGDWIYISTAGDTIERDHLLHLLALGERASADVVISPPRFVDEAGDPHPDLGWPPAKVVAASGSTLPFTLTPEAAFVLAFIHCPSAILGSSASNLYLGKHLRSRPFPVDFSGAGDSVWILRHAASSRICFTPKVGSTFCVHPKEENPSKRSHMELVTRLLAEKRKALERPCVDGELIRALTEEGLLHAKVQDIHRERRGLWHARPRTFKAGSGWTLLTLSYAWQRLRLHLLRGRIRAKLSDGSGFQRVPS